jgi:hypothetical protein
MAVLGTVCCAARLISCFGPGLCQKLDFGLAEKKKGWGTNPPFSGIREFLHNPVPAI